MHTPWIVPWIVPAHVGAGGLALVFGYIALYAAKGASLHRKSGILFVYAMLTMSLTGALMDALITTRMSVSVVAGLVTFYFVTTALLTVRPRLKMSGLDRCGCDGRRADGRYACLQGRIRNGAEREARGSPELHLRRDGPAGRGRRSPHAACTRRQRCPSDRQAPVAYVFCHVDRRGLVLLGAAPPGALRIPALLAVAVLLPIAVMLLWLWRIRVRRTFAGMNRLTTSLS
jgi:hypothetical protein